MVTQNTNDQPAAAVINEMAVKTFQLGSPAEAIGKTLSVAGYQIYRGPNNPNGTILKVIGVVPDIQFQSLKVNPEPNIFLVHEFVHVASLAIRFQRESLPALIPEVERLWSEEFPDKHFKYEFVDSVVAAEYQKDHELGDILRLFSALAISIACLGLYGLISFTAQRRTKEIGIRKAIGATTWQTVLLLLKDFSKPVVIAILIASPIAYLTMSNWLSNFIHHPPLSASYFLITGIGALLIAGLTASTHVVRVARSNPVNALRYE